MDGIRDVLLKRMSEEELSSRVQGVISEMVGLVDEEAAMYVIASDRGDLRGRMTTLDSLTADTWVNLTGHVSSVGWSQTGHVVSWLSLEDGTGRSRIVLWRRELADRIRTGAVVVGDRLLVVNGRVRAGRTGEPAAGGAGLEVHVDARGTVIVLPQTFDEIGSMAEGDVVSIRGVVSSATPAKEFFRRDGSRGLVSTLTVFDGTGEVRAVFWDDAAMSVGGAGVGDEVVISGALVKARDGRLEAHSVRGTRARMLHPA